MLVCVQFVQQLSARKIRYQAWQSPTSWAGRFAWNGCVAESWGMDVLSVISHVIYRSTVANASEQMLEG